MGDVKFRNDFLGEIWVNLKKGAPVIFVAPQREFQSDFCILLAAAKSVVFSKPSGDHPLGFEKKKRENPGRLKPRGGGSKPRGIF